MNFVFFGTPEFAAIILDKLIENGYIPKAVVCNPDRPVGRKKTIVSPLVKQVIRKRKLETDVRILQPEVLDVAFGSGLSLLRSDFFIVAAFAKIIPKIILEIPRLGTIGVHPSLLPKYRGSSPIQTAILNGNSVTGVTLYLLDEKMDHGPILKKKEVKVEDTDDSESLTEKLADLAGKLLAEILPEFLNGRIKAQPQNEAEATYTKKFVTEDAFIGSVDLQIALAGDEEKSQEIKRKIQAFYSEPGAWTLLTEKELHILTNVSIPKNEKKRTKLLQAEIRNGNLIIKKIQIEGEKPRMITL